MAGWFTPTELRLLLVLSDGKPHTRTELHAVLPDELGPYQNVQRHVSNIRKILRVQGQDIVCVWHKRTLCYQQIRLLSACCSASRKP